MAKLFWDLDESDNPISWVESGCSANCENIELAYSAGADFSGANFDGVDIHGILLAGANLEGANLERARLYNADFSGADLSGARLVGADLRDADFSGTNLKGANLEGADLEGANIEGADLEGANLKGAELFGADFKGAELFGANLACASLIDADLSGVDLSRANLSAIREDLRSLLELAPGEVPALREALSEGRVDGEVYRGECACLVGTIARAKGCSVESLKPNAKRPVERWALAIRPGHTPENSQIVNITVGWIDEWLGGVR